MNAAELIELTAAQAAAAVRDGDVHPGELFDAYRERAAAEDLNAFTWVAEGRPDGGPVPSRSPLGGVPVAVKDLFCTEGIPSQAGSRILEGYRPPYTATVVNQLQAAGAPLLGKTNQDEFAMGSSNENSAFGPVLNPWDRTRVPGGSSGGSAAAVAAGLAPVGDRHRHRWLDPSAGRAVRDRRAQAHLRRVLALRDDRVRLLAGPGGPADPDGHRRGAAVLGDGRSRSPRLDLRRLPRAGGAAHRGGSVRYPARRSRGPDRRRRRVRHGDRARGAGELRGDAAPRRGARRHRRSLPPAARAARPVGLLPDRPRRGLGQPGPVRRRPLRPAGRRRR